MGLLGAAELFGPATKELAASTRPNMIGTACSDVRQREHPHVEILHRFPELGEDFGLNDVLDEFAQFVWEAHVAERDEIVCRAFNFVEWLAEHGRPDLAVISVSPLFFDLDEPMIQRLGIGARTAKLIVARDMNGS